MRRRNIKSDLMYTSKREIHVSAITFLTDERTKISNYKVASLLNKLNFFLKILLFQTLSINLNTTSLSILLYKLSIKTSSLSLTTYPTDLSFLGKLHKGPRIVCWLIFM